MAITFSQTPNTHCLADGRVFYGLSTSNQFTNNGVAHVVDFTFSGIPANNADMAFSYGAGAVVLPFVFKTVPDASGLQLPIGGGTVQEFVDLFLLPALQAHAVLYADFDISSITNGVRLTARQKGAYYTTASVILAVGITRAQVAAGIDVVERDNFELHGLVDVLHNGQSYQHSLAAYPYNSTVYVHLNKLLTGFYNRLARPDYTLLACADVSAALIQYRVRWAERFGSPAVTQKLNADAWKYALPGGASMAERSQSDVQQYISSKFFLTRVRRQRVYSTAKAALTYWHTSSETAFNVRFEVTKADTTTVSAVPIVKTGVAQNSLWAIDCSPVTVAAALGIAVADMVSYTVVVVDTSAPGQYHSEFYPFVLEVGAARDYVQLLFQNSFGVYEFAELRGTIERSTTAKADQATLLKNNPARDEALNHTLDKESIDSWQLSTGFLNRSEVEHLKELLRSPDVYMVATGYYMPVRISGHSKALWDTDSGTLNAMNITITQELAEAFA